MLQKAGQAFNWLLYLTSAILVGIMLKFTNEQEDRNMNSLSDF